MATADVRTFWSAFVGVLLRCVAVLGFATRTRTQVPAAMGPTATPSPSDTIPSGAVPSDAIVSGTVASDTTGARRTAPDATAAVGRSAPRRVAARSAPGPRCAYAFPPRRARRGRTLPPTMKQRIRAEAHGASPVARSVLTADAPADVPADGTRRAAAVPATVVPAPTRATVRTHARAALPASRLAAIPAPRPRAHEARCA